MRIEALSPSEPPMGSAFGSNGTFHGGVISDGFSVPIKRPAGSLARTTRVAVPSLTNPERTAVRVHHGTLAQRTALVSDTIQSVDPTTTVE